jgi:hypothetical protein
MYRHRMNVINLQYHLHYCVESLLEHVGTRVSVDVARTYLTGLLEPVDHLVSIIDVSTNPDDPHDFQFHIIYHDPEGQSWITVAFNQQHLPIDQQPIPVDFSKITASFA